MLFAAYNEFVELFNRIDYQITRWMARNGMLALRISLGIVFFWFGVLKFFPGMSPASDLAARTIQRLTFGAVTPALGVPILSTWECLIGLGLLTGAVPRLTLLLLFLQMAGTLTPLIFFPSRNLPAFPVRADAGRSIHHQKPGAPQRRPRPRRHRPGRSPHRRTPALSTLGLLRDRAFYLINSSAVLQSPCRVEKCCPRDKFLKPVAEKPAQN